MPISSPPKKWISLSEIHAFLKFYKLNKYRIRCVMFHKKIKAKDDDKVLERILLAQGIFEENLKKNPI